MKFSNLFVSALLSMAMASDVVDLSSSIEDFNNFVNEHSVVLAKFYAPWCGHCKTLAPEYEAAASELKDKDVALVEVDCTQNQELCAEHKVKGYPTLMVFRGPDASTPYNGGRTSNEIISYMSKELLPPLTIVDPSNLDAFTNSSDTVGLVLFENDDEATNKTITDIATKFHHQFSFGASSDKELIKQLGVETLPAFVVFANHKEKPVIIDSNTKGFEFTDNGILAQLMRNSIVPGGEIGPETFRAYMASGLPLAYFFYNTVEQRKEFSESLAFLATEFSDRVNIGFIDAVKYGSHAPNINLNDKDFPAFAIHNLESNKKFPISQDQELTVELISQHIRDFVEDKLVPDIKSEPVPEVQEGPVYKAVLDNYDELVLDDEKDVLIEFYAPWCGHCKKLAPIYDELGALYFNDSELGKKVTVAKMDHSANEFEGVEIAGYPTIMLFPAGKKDSPVVFESGARTLEALNDFIRDKGTHGVDGLANKQKSAKPKKSKKTKRSKKAKKAKKAAPAGNDEL